MALNPIFWLARWGTTPAVMPVFLIASILLMIPKTWEFVASLWIHSLDIPTLNKGHWFIVRMIPFLNYISIWFVGLLIFFVILLLIYLMVICLILTLKHTLIKVMEKGWKVCVLFH